MQIIGGLSTFSKISNPLKVYVLKVLMYSVGLPTFAVRCTPWVLRGHKCQSAVELTFGVILGWVFQRPKPRDPGGPCAQNAGVLTCRVQLVLPVSP